MAFTNLGFEDRGGVPGAAQEWSVLLEVAPDEGLMDLARYDQVTTPPSVSKAQELDQAPWTATNCTVAADATTAPDGTTTAERITFNAAAGLHGVRNGSWSVAEGKSYTWSCWLKKDTWNYAGLMVTSDATGTTYIRLIFDFATWRVICDAPGQDIAATSARVTTYDSGSWFLLELEFEVGSSFANLYGYVQGFGDADGALTFTPAGTEAFFAWNAELHDGSLLPRETFVGWGSNEGFVFSFTTELAAASYETVVVTPKLLEDFEEKWSSNESYFFAAPPLTAASYDTTPENVEDFEEDWSTNESYLFALPAVTAPSYDGTPEAFEDFEEDWSSNQSYSYALPAVTAATYASGDAFENYETGWTTTMTTL